MRTFTIYFLSLVAGLMMSGCIIIEDDDDGPGGCVRGSNDIVVREYFLPDMRGLEFFLSGEVRLQQGTRQIVEVEGPDNILDLLEFNISNGIWEIDTRRCYSDAHLIFYITLEDIELLRTYGSGRIFGENSMDVNDLELDVIGSGDIDLELNADDIEADIEGSGDLLLYGTGDELNLDIDGSGDFGTFGFECERADISILGSGNAEITVDNVLDVYIAGSGNVYYRGFPGVSADIVGSGQVVDAN